MYKSILAYYEKNKKIIWQVSGVTFLSALLAYYLFIIWGHTLPDGLCEGFRYYFNANWQLACGRWAVRYLNLLIGCNLVMPLIIVFLYAVCVIIAVMILKEEWGIKSRMTLFLIAGIMMVNEAVITQMPFAYITLTYAFSLILTMLFWCFGKRKQRVFQLLAIISLAIAMGLYQSYLCVAIVLCVLGAVIDIFNEKKLSLVVKEMCQYFVLGVFAGILYFIILKVELCLRGINESERLSEVSFGNIIFSWLEKTIDSYRVFFEFFCDRNNGRWMLWLLFSFVMIIAFIYVIIKMMKQRKYIEVVVCILLCVSIPVCMNFIYVLIPDSVMHLLMKYQYILVIPFGLVIIERFFDCECKHLKQLGMLLSSLAACGILSTYVITANATFESLKISYDVIQVQTELILADVYDMEGFVPNNSRIVFAGFPSDSVAKENLQLYQYAVGLSENAVYWESMGGLKQNRKQYLLYYCGIDGGDFTDEEYYNIVNSEEFKNMPLWPADGSVKMFNDMAVVKLTETPLGIE